MKHRCSLQSNPIHFYHQRSYNTSFVLLICSIQIADNHLFHTPLILIICGFQIFKFTYSLKYTWNLETNTRGACVGTPRHTRAVRNGVARCAHSQPGRTLCLLLSLILHKQVSFHGPRVFSTLSHIFVSLLVCG